MIKLSFLQPFTWFLLFSFPLSSAASTKIIGYLPSYKGLKDNINAAQLSKLTHLNIAFLNPDRDGHFVDGDTLTCMTAKRGNKLTSKELSSTVDLAHQENVKVLMSIGGAIMPACAGDWRTLLSDNNRHQLINELMTLVQHYHLDGLDVDLESALLMHLIDDKSYLPFIKNLSAKLKAKNKLLTAATGSYVGGMIPVQSIPYFDFINVMSYDAIGPTWGKPGVEHATIEQAKRDLLLWQKRGVDKHKLILGLPFYGYGFGKYQANYSISAINKQFGDKILDQDVIGSVCASCDYITFNGKSTITAKTKLALQLGGGVMVWELTHDLTDENSLLSVIDSTVNQ
ncbi:glycosyl hydrolase family 18 protein [Colwelliaceae bacterium 6441]